MEGKLKIAVMISGGGTTLQNLIDLAAGGALPVEIAVVVSSRADAYGITRAQDAGIPALAVPSRDYAKSADHSRAVTEVIDRYRPDLLVMAGYMCYYRIPPAYQGRVVNVHPSLIPAFCGKGLYGHRVHEAVVAYGARVSGCTVHFVDNEYDRGPIILQRVVPVLSTDTPDALAERVQAAERVAYPEAIRLYAEGRLHVEGRTVRVLPGPWQPTSMSGAQGHRVPS